MIFRLTCLQAYLLRSRDVAPIRLVDFCVDLINYFFVVHTPPINVVRKPDPLARIGGKLLSYGRLRPDVFVNNRHAHPYVVFCNVENHVVRGQGQRAIVGLADPFQNRGQRVKVIEEMRGVFALLEIQTYLQY